MLSLSECKFLLSFHQKLPHLSCLLFLGHQVFLPLWLYRKNSCYLERWLLDVAGGSYIMMRGQVPPLCNKLTASDWCAIVIPCSVCHSGCIYRPNQIASMNNNNNDCLLLWNPIRIHSEYVLRRVSVHFSIVPYDYRKYRLQAETWMDVNMWYSGTVCLYTVDIMWSRVSN